MGCGCEGLKKLHLPYINLPLCLQLIMREQIYVCSYETNLTPSQEQEEPEGGSNGGKKIKTCTWRFGEEDDLTVPEAMIHHGFVCPCNETKTSRLIYVLEE